MKPATFIIAESHAMARVVASDLGLIPTEWRSILSFHDALTLRGLEGPARNPASRYRVVTAPRAPRSYSDIVRELTATGFFDAEGRPARTSTPSESETR